MALRPALLFYTALLISLKASSQLHLRQTIDSGKRNVQLRVLPQNFYTKHMGFMCKKELQLQKLMALPLYFRLGTKEYVDRLERKPNYFEGNKD
jgi:hypothetical protein